MRILLVEDDPGVRGTVARMLEYLGHTTTAVSSGEEAGRLPDDPPFEAVLTDLRLPGMAGDKVIGRQRERWPQLKALIMSGDTDGDVIRAGERAGRWRILPKPFDLDQLAAGLQDLLVPDV